MVRRTGKDAKTKLIIISRNTSPSSSFKLVNVLCKSVIGVEEMSELKWQPGCVRKAISFLGPAFSEKSICVAGAEALVCSSLNN